MALQDVRNAALLAQGYSGADNDMLLAWARFNGAQSIELNDALLEVLHLNGATSISLPDAWYQFLLLQGYSGSFPGMEYLFWLNGGSLAPIAIFNAPLLNTLIPTIGTFASFTRGDADATLEDFQPLAKPVLADEARFWGARNVKNIGVTLANGTGLTTELADFIGNVTFGTESGHGMRVACTTTTTSVSAVLRNNYIPTGIRITNQAQIKLNTALVGSTTIDMYRGVNFDRIPVADNTMPVGQWTNISVTNNTITVSTAREGFALDNHGIGETIDFEIRNLQTLFVQDQTDTDPSDYVSVGVLSAPWNGANVDTVQYFGDNYSEIVIPDNTLKGLLIERASTNLADTNLTGTQTIASPGLGDWTISCKGTSSFTITLGTPANGSISDANCTEVSPAHLDLTGVSTIIITLTSGTLDTDQDGNNIIQCENKATHTSLIPSPTTGSVIRLAESAEYVQPAALQQSALSYTIRGEFYLPQDGVDFNESHYICSVGSDSDRMEMYIASNGSFNAVSVSNGVGLGRSTSARLKGRHRFAVKFNATNGRHGLSIDGEAVVNSAVNPNTQDMSRGTNKAIWIGSDISQNNQADFPVKLFECFDEYFDDADLVEWTTL